MCDDDDLGALLSQLADGRTAEGGGAAKDDTFYSAADERSWLSAPRDGTADRSANLDTTLDNAVPADRTLSPAKDAEPAEDEENIEDELRQLELKMQRLRSQLKGRKADNATSPQTSGTTQRGPRACDIDFSAPTDRAKPAGPGSSTSVVRAGDSSSSEDEWHRNRDAGADDGFATSGPLTAEARALKKRLKTASERGGKLKTPVKGSLAASPTKHLLSEMRQNAKKAGEALVASSHSGKAEADVFDQFFAIRIRTPLVSSASFAGHTADRVRLRLEQLSARQGALRKDVSSHWLSMGVVVEASGRRTSANNKPYSVWTLSDLRDCAAGPFKLWLFGDALSKHWKVGVGRVVAVFGAGFMDDAGGDKASQYKKSKAALSMKAHQSSQIVELGAAADFGTCRGTRKSDGAPCTNFVNVSQSDYCTYHLSAATRALTARRGELRTGAAAEMRPMHKRVFGERGQQQVIYGGKCVGAPAGAAGGKSRAPITAQKLHTAQAPGGTTAGGKKLPLPPPPAAGRVKTALVQAAPNEEESKLLDMLQVPSAGSRNFSAALVRKENKDDRHPSDGGGGGSQPSQQAASGKRTARCFLSARRPLAPPPPQQQRAGHIDLGDAPESSARPPVVDRAKLRAMQLLKAGGGLTSQDRPTKRKAAATGQAGVVPTANRPANRSPTKKRGKLSDSAGSDAIARALAVRSAHEHEVDEEERRRQDDYFTVLEAKEKVETRMVNTFDVKNCNVVSCKRCGYTWHMQSDYCKRQGHVIIRHKADRRFFKCNQCAKRLVAYVKYPLKPCMSCQSTSFSRTGMKEERRGAALPTEKLAVTGEFQQPPNV